MSSTNDIIFIKSTAKRNGLTTLLIGTIALLLSAAMLIALPDWLFLIGIFMVSGAIVTMLIGWFKIREPEHSLSVDRERILYQHRCGQWQIAWDNIQRIDCPRVQQGLSLTPLNMVGFKLKHYDDFILAISPRLASHLIMEQRALLMHSEDKSCATGGCYSSSLFEDKPYQLADGQVVTGIKAILANRMITLRQIFGYDVFLSASELDRSPEAFVSLLRDCQQSRH
ncbi:DUF2982 domain-containing protein [Aestuariibacter sp. GS-14]|uniref:DUF2982 domain-containing protein n=1 Tax=Aestuariibacter sp. GS-14 TaxID=2590670 RepID=UPI001126A173|nr:DUF2982 domain-containing protein [Aestuariibacter sp. GS-14]TPV58421.1 DUF2982 domain-containing protein [Aestuariibacter sp. GS-14]